MSRRAFYSHLLSYKENEVQGVRTLSIPYPINELFAVATSWLTYISPSNVQLIFQLKTSNKVK